MAKKRDEDLFKRMRSLGVRKSRAREVAEAVRNSPKAAPKAARKAAGDLSGAVVEIQDRLNHGPQKRREAAKRRPGRESGTPRAAARPPRRRPAPAPRPNQPSAAAGTPPRREGSAQGPGRGLEAGAHLRASSSPNTTGPPRTAFADGKASTAIKIAWFIGGAYSLLRQSAFSDWQERGYSFVVGPRRARKRTAADRRGVRLAAATAHHSAQGDRIPGSGSFMRRVEVGARRAKKRAAADR